jgi:uncharacterized protein YecE (DUF72 family)
MMKNALNRSKLSFYGKTLCSSSNLHIDVNIEKANSFRANLKDSLASLAKGNVFVGTSSWKYPGWCGLLYDEQRYVWRGKFAESRFNKGCLAEYAEVFKTVCVDAAYYKFPDRRYLEDLVSQVPEDFLFTFKVTDTITIRKFTNLPRFGTRAGKPNEHFLDAGLFIRGFLQPCEEFKKNIGLLMFEFSRFYPADFAHGRDFVEALDKFLGQLPKGGWNYGVEIRNPSFLKPEYFSMLARHGVAHIFNSWAGMPAVSDQLVMPGSVTTPAVAGARLLLKPGRKYEDAVREFSPYREVKDVYEDARIAAAKLIQKALSKDGVQKLFLYVNNRLEGNALQTIIAVLARIGKVIPQ